MRNTLFACSALALLASWPAIADEVGRSSVNKFTVTAATGWCAGEEVRLRITLAADSPLAKAERPWEAVKLAALMEKQCPAAKRAIFDVIDAAGANRGTATAQAPSWAATKADDKTAAAASSSAPPVAAATASAPPAAPAPLPPPGAAIAAYRQDITGQQAPTVLGVVTDKSGNPVRLQIGPSRINYLGQASLNPPWAHSVVLEGQYNAPAAGVYLLVLETAFGLGIKDSCDAELYVGGKSVAVNDLTMTRTRTRDETTASFNSGLNKIMVRLSCRAAPGLVSDQGTAIAGTSTTVMIKAPDGELRPLRYADLYIVQ